MSGQYSRSSLPLQYVPQMKLREWHVTHRKQERDPSTTRGKGPTPSEHLSSNLIQSLGTLGKARFRRAQQKVCHLLLDLRRHAFETQSTKTVIRRPCKFLGLEIYRNRKKALSWEMQGHDKCGTLTLPLTRELNHCP